MSIERKANLVLEQAKRLAEKVDSWADFSAALFDYSTGAVTASFPDEMERQAFFDSEQHEEINRMLIDLMKKHGVVNGARKSGKFVVRVAKTIHEKLEAEAKLEGVSLNQLAATKLSLPLKESAKSPGGRDIVIKAFNSVHEGHSADWVVLEPYHNKLFIERCRELGLVKPDEYWLNHLLMNTRKNPKYKGRLNRATKRSGFSDYDDCFYAAEIAIRTLQRTRGVTLDRALCDPILRASFDQIATRLAPGQTDLKLRCAALNLRKTHKLRPTADRDAGLFDLVTVGPANSLSISTIAELPGTYVFYDYKRPIYAGETENLQKRIDLHLKGGLPDWLEVQKDEGLILKSLVLPNVKKEARLQWLGSFINRERPLLNYQKAA